MDEDFQKYNAQLRAFDQEICYLLFTIIESELADAEKKIWHAHPVWFIDGNPIVGFSKLKDCIQLMFWSGADFDEEKLQLGSGKFKDASIRFTKLEQIDTEELARWLKKARTIQWDYKNIVKRKGKLERIQ
ncbi:MAG: DUF1801 domain-containing protein [Crocinitomicaceae bacterium]|jgi:hypothetical protein|nr:DUF1801 domain-containing protein [Crocinitomicaceae bacterium]MCF8411434.1 DUF1801 domain-containing protein [Crocinitomicaceae bacterium]